MRKQRRRGRYGQALALALAVGGPVAVGPVAAQQDTFASPELFAAPILTLDQDRLYSESLYGQRVQAEVEEQSRQLAERNRQLTAELTAEEKDLTERRKTLTPEEFRQLADAFDQKVTQLRAGQDARIRMLQRQREEERRRFSSRIAPVLTDLVLESGAVAILDERAVILSADQIDVTDRAIARIDAILGDGGDLSPAAPETEAPVAGEAAPEAPDAASPANSGAENSGAEPAPDDSLASPPADPERDQTGGSLQTGRPLDGN